MTDWTANTGNSTTYATDVDSRSTVALNGSTVALNASDVNLLGWVDGVIGTGANWTVPTKVSTNWS